MNEVDLQKSAMFLESNICGILLIDQDASILFANAWFVSRSQKQEKEILGKSLYKLYPHLSQRVIHAIESAIKHQKSGIISEKFNYSPFDLFDTKNAVNLQSLRLNIYPLQDSNGNHQITKIEIIDISDNIKREQNLTKVAQELEVTKQQLIQSAKLIALGELTGGIAHEIKNPLAIIKLRSDQAFRLLENQTTEHIEKVSNMLKSNHETCIRIEKIITGILAFCHTPQKDDFINYNFVKIVDDSLAICESNFKSKGVTISYEKRLDFASIDCNPSQISQIIVNLLNNARDAVLEAQNKSKLIQIELIDSEDKYTFSISDSGDDIPLEITLKMMNPFFTTKKIGVGTGLGLSISHNIAQNHNGKLIFQARKDYGTKRFLLVLPKATSNEF